MPLDNCLNIHKCLRCFGERGCHRTPDIDQILEMLQLWESDESTDDEQETRKVVEADIFFIEILLIK